MKIDKKENLMIITADEGMVLTEWREDEDILDFTYCTTMYAPVLYDPSYVREITEMEKDMLESEQLRILAEMEK